MDKKDYFQTWELQLITYFLFNEAPIKNYRGLIAINYVDSSINELQEVLIKISNISFEMTKKLFKCSKYTDNEIVIQLNKEDVVDSTYIKNQLKEYLEAFKNDDLKDFKQQCFSYEYELSSFCKLIKETYNLKDFKLNDWKFLPIVLIGYFDNLINIENVYVNFPVLEPFRDEEGIHVIEDLIGEDKIAELVDDFLDFNCDLDVTKFAQKYIPKEKPLKKSQKNKVARKDLYFSPQQIKILKFIVKKAREGEEHLPMAEFYKFLEDTDGKEDKINNNDVSHAISKLNSQYNLRFNTKNKIIEYNRKIKMYSITESFLDRINL